MSLFHPLQQEAGWLKLPFGVKSPNSQYSLKYRFNRSLNGLLTPTSSHPFYLSPLESFEGKCLLGGPKRTLLF